MNREELVRAMDRYNQAVEELKQAELDISHAGMFVKSTKDRFAAFSKSVFSNLPGQPVFEIKHYGPYGMSVRMKKQYQGKYAHTVEYTYLYKRMWESWGRLWGEVNREYDSLFTCIKCGGEELASNTGGLLVVADGYFVKSGIYKFTEREGNIDNIEFVTPLDFEPYLDDDTGHLCHNCREHYKTML